MTVRRHLKIALAWTVFLMYFFAGKWIQSYVLKKKNDFRTSYDWTRMFRMMMVQCLIGRKKILKTIIGQGTLKKRQRTLMMKICWSLLMSLYKTGVHNLSFMAGQKWFYVVHDCSRSGVGNSFGSAGHIRDKKGTEGQYIYF